MKDPKIFDKFLADGIRDFEAGLHEAALANFRRAVVADFSMPEAWFWIGRVYEERAQGVLAAHSYYMACDMRPDFSLARTGLKRLGYIQDFESEGGVRSRARHLLFQEAGS